MLKNLFKTNSIQIFSKNLIYIKIAFQRGMFSMKFVTLVKSKIVKNQYQNYKWMKTVKIENHQVMNKIYKILKINNTLYLLLMQLNNIRKTA